MRLGVAIGVALLVAGCGAGRTSTQVPGGAREVPGSDGGSSAATASAEKDAGAGTGTSTGSSGAVDGGGGSSLPVAVATAKAHTEGKHYALDVTAPGTIAVGGGGAFQVTLAAKDGYHINNDYPYKLKASADPDGIVTFEVPELSKKDGKYTKTVARFELKFTGARAGVARVGGTMELSVCSKKDCILDKIALEVPVTVR
jgi:hypothetical protein